MSTEFHGEGIFNFGIFLTLCTCISTNSKSNLHISHVLLHFLFLCYTVSILKLIFYLTCSSKMETIKATLAFHKSQLGKKLLAFL